MREIILADILDYTIDWDTWSSAREGLITREWLDQQHWSDISEEYPETHVPRQHFAGHSRR